MDLDVLGANGVGRLHHYVVSVGRPAAALGPAPEVGRPGSALSEEYPGSLRYYAWCADIERQGVDGAEEIEVEQGRRSCILVADDDPDILNLVQRRLTLDGHDVVPARDGDEAMALARTHEPDALVLDVVMPGQDGLALTRWARAEYPDRHIPIILLSARTQANDIARGLAAGADEYLTKPFSRDDLRERLRRLISEGQRAV